MIFHFLMQVAQQAPVYITPTGGIDNGPNIWTIICAVGVALGGIGALIGWFIRWAIPKALTSFDERTGIYKNTVEAIPSAIKEVASLVVEVKNDVKASVIATEGRIIEAIQDQKFKEISSKLDEHDQKLKDLSPK